MYVVVLILNGTLIPIRDVYRRPFPLNIYLLSTSIEVFMGFEAFF